MAIKLMDPNFKLKIVSIHDEAIDKSNSDLKEYSDTRDLSLLKFLEGLVPTYWEIINVSSPEQVEIQQDHYITEMPKIEAGETIEDLKNKKVSVKAVRQGEMILKYFKAGCKKMIDGDKVTEIDENIMKLIPSPVLNEIGSLIMVRSTVGDSKKK